MTREFGTLLAQVIPVLLLAMMLELRSILRASEEENASLRRIGVRTKDEMRVAKIRRRVAELIGVEVDIPPEAGEPTGKNSLFSRYYWNGLSKFDAMAIAAIFGVLMLALARAEFVALMAATGASIPAWEQELSLIVIAVALVAIVVFPVGLEVYKMVGLIWSPITFLLYGIVGFVAMATFLVSISSYLSDLSP